MVTVLCTIKRVFYNACFLIAVCFNKSPAGSQRSKISEQLSKSHIPDPGPKDFSFSLLLSRRKAVAEAQI